MANFRPPAFAYLGGKARLASCIAGMLPLNAKRYVDVFAGRGNVFFAAASLHYDEYWLNDPATADFFLALQNWDSKISVPCIATREEMEGYRELLNGGDCKKKIIATLLEPYLTYWGLGYASNCVWYNDGHKITAQGYIKNLLRAKEIVQSTLPVITNWDWKNVVRCLEPTDIAFFDPPYIGASSRLYSYTVDNYEDLISALEKAEFKWLLTERRSDLYLSRLGNPFMEFNVPRSNLTTSGPNKNQKVMRTECIWKNY